MIGIRCRRLGAASRKLCALYSSRSSLPEGFRSPQAVADAVAAAIAAERDTERAHRPQHSHVPAEPLTQTAKIERRRLDGDVITTKKITAPQLMFPSTNPDWQIITSDHFERVPSPNDWDAGLEELQQRIGVRFQQLTLLKSALTHHGCLPNYSLPDGVPLVRLSNRSLEFLGDSLLGAAAAGYVYQTLPKHQEGQLSRAKSAIVNNETLSKISADLGITELLLWPAGLNEASSASLVVKGRVTIAAGAVESLIAAVYLDQGMETALNFVTTHILPRAVEYATRDVIWEPIVELQNLLQGHYYGHPVYKYLPAAANASEYTAELYVKRRPVCKATAPSYKLARARAAEIAYWHFEKLLGPAP